jgi:serine protease AprX
MTVRKAGACPRQAPHRAYAWVSVPTAILLAASVCGPTFSAPVSSAATVAQKGDNFLKHSSSQHGWTSVIARLNGPLTNADSAHLKSLNATIVQRIPMIQSVALRLPSRSMAKLAAMPFIQHLSADVTVKKDDEFTVGDSGASAAWQQYNVSGAGVTVAVVDSGIHGCKDLKTDGVSRIIKSVNFVPGETTAEDECGHGTHVAGIIAGNGASSTGKRYFQTFYGIAQQAQLINVRVLDSQGSAQLDTVLAGLQWVYNHQQADNIRVVNLSMGHPVGESYKTDPMCQAVEALWKEGIVVVCAAGNDGRLNTDNVQTAGMDNDGFGTSYGSIESPGNDPDVITVGAMKSTDGTRTDDTIATYSSRGPTFYDNVLKPDIVAPGNLVVSLEASPTCTLATEDSDTNQIPFLLHDDERCRFGSLLPPFWNQHGDTGDFRGCRASVAARPDALSEHRQGPLNGFRRQVAES